MYLLLCSPNAFAEQFLCVPDKATGFYYDKVTNKWDYTKINSNNFIISPSNDGQYAYTFTEVGYKGPTPGWCERDFNNAGMLFCTGFHGDLKFNRVNRRYLRVFSDAYITVGIAPLKETDENSGMPMVEIGKCEPF
jgi:hypothetical protein